MRSRECKERVLVEHRASDLGVPVAFMEVPGLPAPTSLRAWLREEVAGALPLPRIPVRGREGHSLLHRIRRFTKSY